MQLDGNFKEVTKDNLTYFVSKKWQEDPRVTHCFTTRLGGVSTGCLSSLNLGFNRGDTHNHVMQNYQRVCDVLAVELESVVLSKQVHEAHVVKVESEDAGNGILYSSKWDAADGMYTRRPGVTLVTHYADCVPLLFYAPDYSIVGVTHSGWRGTVKQIAKVLIDTWVIKENIPREAIEVAIGPSIGKCCFEVGEEVGQAFTKQFGEQPFIFYDTKKSKYHIDLWETNKYILRTSGIKAEKIVTSGVCTCCNEDVCFSHRKSEGNRGTLGAFIALRSLGDE